MDIINVTDVSGTEFPAGRRTRVLVGENLAHRAVIRIGHIAIRVNVIKISVIRIARQGFSRP